MQKVSVICWSCFRTVPAFPGLENEAWLFGPVHIRLPSFVGAYKYPVASIVCVCWVNDENP